MWHCHFLKSPSDIEPPSRAPWVKTEWALLSPGEREMKTRLPDRSKGALLSAIRKIEKKTNLGNSTDRALVGASSRNLPSVTRECLVSASSIWAIYVFFRYLPFISSALYGRFIWLGHAKSSCLQRFYCHLHGTPPLKSTEWHGYFLNPTRRHGP